jgi:hypothetical protein
VARTPRPFCRTALLAAAALVIACQATPETAPPATTSCESFATEIDGRCVPRFDACGETEVPQLGGGCLSIGVRECSDGFATDGRGGCAPVLPAEACGDGRLAVPGDTSCHPLADDCGGGDAWGSIGSDSTIFVAAGSASGGDGSRAKPFATITEAIASAASGATVAIAAGEYVESLAIDKPLTLHGVCPESVILRGADTSVPTLAITAQTTLERLDVTGPAWGVSSSGPLTLSRVRIHDTGHSGLEAYAKTTVTDSLFERNTDDAIYTEGAEVTVTRTAIRDVAPSKTGKAGNGIHAEIQADPPLPAHVTVTRTIVERATEAGVAALASKVEIEGSVIRDTRVRPADGKLGVGLYASNAPKSGAHAALAVRGSLIERNRRANVYAVGGDVTIATTVIRAGLSRTDTGPLGLGIEVVSGVELAVSDSLVDANRYAGIAVYASHAVVDRTIVRETIPSSDGLWGAGIVSWFDAGRLSEVTVRTSRIANNTQSGVVAGGGTLSLDGCAVVGTKPSLAGLFGDGVFVGTRREGGTEYPASAGIAASLVENNARAGALVVGGGLQIGTSILRCNAFDLELTEVYGHSDAGEPWTHAVEAVPTEPLACGCGATTTGCHAQSADLEPIDAPLHGAP